VLIPVTPAVEHLQGEHDRSSPQSELGNEEVQYDENNDVRGVSGDWEAECPISPLTDKRRL
jgi:hypothetical protein